MRGWLALVGSCHTFLGIKYATQLSPESSLEPGKTCIAVSAGPIWNRVPTGAVVFPSHLEQLFSAPLLVRMGTGSKSTAEPLPSERRVAGEDAEVWADSVELYSPHCGDPGTQQNTVCQLSDRQLKMLCYC